MYFLWNKLKITQKCKPVLPLLCQRKTTHTIKNTPPSIKNAQPSVSSPVKLAYISFETDVIANTEVSPLIIMHGLYASARNLKSIASCIHLKTKPQRNVYVLDARNHGRSPHTITHTYEDLTNDIAKFCADHMINRTVLMGHSMGGRAMMCVALKHPEMVEKAIIIDIAPVNNLQFIPPTRFFDVLRAVNVSSDLSLVDGRKEANRQLQKLGIDQESKRQFILMNLTKEEKGGQFGWKLNVTTLENAFEDIIRSISGDLMDKKYDGPVLFVAGGKSTFLGQSNFPDILKLFPKATLEIVEGAGHSPHITNPDEMLRLSLEFLNAI